MLSERVQYRMSPIQNESNTEWVQYKGKAGFLIEFSKQYFSEYWQMWSRRVFAQTVGHILLITWSHLYVAKASSFFKCLNTCHTTLNFITDLEVLCIATYVQLF